VIEASPAARHLLEQAAALPAADLRYLALAIARRCVELEEQYEAGCRCGLCDAAGVGDTASRYFVRRGWTIERSRLGEDTRVTKGA